MIMVDSGEKNGLSWASKDFNAAKHLLLLAILKVNKIQEKI